MRRRLLVTTGLFCLALRCLQGANLIITERDFFSLEADIAGLRSSESLAIFSTATDPGFEKLSFKTVPSMMRMNVNGAMPYSGPWADRVSLRYRESRFYWSHGGVLEDASYRSFLTHRRFRKAADELERAHD